jgi:hypothetical protein
MAPFRDEFDVVIRGGHYHFHSSNARAIRSRLPSAALLAKKKVPENLRGGSIRAPRSLQNASGQASRAVPAPAGGNCPVATSSNSRAVKARGDSRPLTIGTSIEGK